MSHLDPANPTHEPSNAVDGLLFIGDPHLEARVPGFRSDDFPLVALEKFRWCLQHAREHHLQPILLGDLFQYPQDNPNWLLSEIISSIDDPLPAIYGNHDVRENTLKPNDSIHVLAAGGKLRWLSADAPWQGKVNGIPVVVGGSCWGQALPKSFSREAVGAELVVWITHHDILIPGYEEAGRIRPKPIPGIDLVINGHIHRRLPTVTKATTHWLTPGNITRRSRGDASRTRVPAVLCLRPTDHNVPAHVDESAQIPAQFGLDTEPSEAPPQDFTFAAPSGTQWTASSLTVPHRPFDEVFHPEVETVEGADEHGSAFIADLRELTARRTDSGAGLANYLRQHLSQFEPAVATEILRLAEDVLGEAITADSMPDQ